MKHLKENNLTYFQHMKIAFGFGWKSLKITLALFVHGLIPCLFKDYASIQTRVLHLEFEWSKFLRKYK